MLGGTEVTNAGLSDVSGDVGVSPAASITGFPPGKITNGIKHVNDGPAATAQAQLTASYLGLAVPPSTATTSEVGGQTLVPGAYDASSDLNLNGTVTLNGQGNSNSVFIFRAGRDLDVAQSSVVRLTNGASACNVFWKVDRTATIGHDANFVGTVEALTSIVADDNATVHGRLLARNAEVTLINDTITAPTDCAGTPGGGGGPSSSSSGAARRQTPATPTVSGVAPDNGPTAGGTSVTVTGTGFTTTGTVVKVGGTPLPSSQVTVHGSTSLTFVTPPHAAGRTTFTVTTPNGTTRPHTFTYHRATTTTTVLAATGNADGQLLGVAALLVLAGGGTLMVARRRTYRPHH